jgi:alkylation response protein AidB-like acyl-CoA dehydrogenase
VLATALGSDPIAVGATGDQKKLSLTRLAEEGLLFAYGATEPEAGSDLGALRTTATPPRQGDVLGGEGPGATVTAGRFRSRAGMEEC